ncbi:High mobility group nucleosome-binding domain-containing protein 4, partial [Lemmus lemmus]
PHPPKKVDVEGNKAEVKGRPQARSPRLSVTPVFPKLLPKPEKAPRKAGEESIQRANDAGKHGNSPAGNVNSETDRARNADGAEATCEACIFDNCVFLGTAQPGILFLSSFVKMADFCFPFIYLFLLKGAMLLTQTMSLFGRKEHVSPKNVSQPELIWGWGRTPFPVSFEKSPQADVLAQPLNLEAWVQAPEST